MRRAKTAVYCTACTEGKKTSSGAWAYAVMELSPGSIPYRTAVLYIHTYNGSLHQTSGAAGGGRGTATNSNSSLKRNGRQAGSRPTYSPVSYQIGGRVVAG